MAHLSDLFLHRNYVHSDAHLKEFGNIIALEKSAISMQGISLADITENVEVEIRSPPLLIVHQHKSINPKSPITSNTTGRNEVLQELTKRMRRREEFKFLLRYSKHMKPVLQTLIETSVKNKTMRVNNDNISVIGLPEISLFLTTPNIDPAFRFTSEYGVESRYSLSVLTSNVPMWLVELTDIMFIITRNSKSTGILDRSFQSSIDVRYTTIINRKVVKKKVIVDKVITYSQIKQTRSKVSLDEIKYSKNIESIPTVIDPDEGEEFYRVSQSRLRRILNRQAFTNSIKDLLGNAGIRAPIGITDTNLVIYISDVITIGTNAKNVMKSELEFELSSDISNFIAELAEFSKETEEERTVMRSEIQAQILRQILYLIKIFSGSYIAPTEITRMFSNYYNSIGSIRQKPVDLDHRNGVSIHSESTGAFLTNKLDGVRRLVILHARHIYLVWKEVGRIRYRLIGYDKTGVLGKMCIVLDTELYETDEMKYIGVFDVLSQDSCADLSLSLEFNRIETFLIIESGKKLVNNINDSGALSNKYTLEFKPHVYISNPRDISQYMRAASKIKSLSGNMKLDGYILISDIARTSVARSSRTREALDETLPVPATSPSSTTDSTSSQETETKSFKVPTEPPKQPKVRTRYNSIFKVKTKEDYTIDLLAGDERLKPVFDRVLQLLERLMKVKYTSLMAPGAFEEMVRNSSLVISMNLVIKEAPLVYRYDKSTPNDNLTIDNVLKVVELRNKNKTIQQYLKTTLGTRRPMMYAYHNGCKNKLFNRAYTISMAMNSIQTPGDISIDIGSGRGGDLHKIMNNSSKIILLTEPNEQYYSGKNGLLHRIRNYKKGISITEELMDVRIKLIRFEIQGKIVYTARISTFTNLVPSDKETPDNMSSDVIDWELRTKLKSRTAIGQLVEVIMEKESLIKVHIRNVFTMSTVTVLDNRTGAKASVLPLNPTYIGNRIIIIMRELMKLSIDSIVLTIFGFDGIKFFRSHKLFPHLPKGVGFKVTSDPDQTVDTNPIVKFNTKGDIIRISKVNRKWLERTKIGIKDTGKYYQAAEIVIHNPGAPTPYRYEESLINFQKFIPKITRGYDVTIAYNAWASEKTGSMDPAEDLFSAFNFGIVLIYHK